MSRIPKFIRSDKVCHIKNDSDRIMHIEKFKTILEINTNKPIYTGLVCCYWFEGTVIRRATYDEDELEKIKSP